jgi:hypothetical protein
MDVVCLVEKQKTQSQSLCCYLSHTGGGLDEDEGTRWRNRELLRWRERQRNGRLAMGGESLSPRSHGEVSESLVVTLGS